jgi:hypothetical protein
MNAEKEEKILLGLNLDLEYYFYKYGDVHTIRRIRDVDTVKLNLLSYIVIKTKNINKKYCKI